MRHVRSALLLAGAALAAVSGCVTVAGGQRPEEGGPPAPPTGPALPRQDTGPPRTPGAARETLARVEEGPERPGTPSPPRYGSPSASAPAFPPATRPAPRPPRRERLPSGPARPERASGGSPGGSPRWPGTDVCGLGEAYGGWAADGEPARTCRQVYGD
ncbi:hypothetical protein [Streptomyces atacamensis]|uniref:hypothetical protein n=1 Tax=Streptomyces atacamensis TaxID=531966 RepID=UPI00399CF1F7